MEFTYRLSLDPQPAVFSNWSWLSLLASLSLQTDDSNTSWVTLGVKRKCFVREDVKIPNKG